MTFREHLASPGAFVVAAELVTSRGLITAGRGREVVERAQALAADPHVDVLSITDNPGGNAMLAPDTLGTDLVAAGQEVIIHLSCKDWNRNALESRGWQLGSEGFENVLALSGDYPVAGHAGAAAPVFDLDSVGLLSLLAEMNEGLSDARRPEERLDRTDFFLGCVVTNHKRHEREVMPQYLKLKKKVQAGARFVINQIGWNARKDDELLRFVRREQLPVGMLANVYILSRPAARAFHAGKIPGVVVSEELLELVERYAAGADNGREFFVDLAARHVAVARGLGFQGVYLGGHWPAATFGEILDRAAAYDGEAWKELGREIRFGFAGEFHLFEEDPETGLASDSVSASYLESRARRRTALRVPVSYRVSRRVHDASLRARGAASSPPGARSTRRSSTGRSRSRARSTPSSRRSRCRSSTAATVGTARCRRSRTSAPSPSARRTSATARAAAPATASARSTTRSASGPRPTSGSRPMVRRRRCWRGRWW